MLKGSVLIGQSGGPTSVINSSLAGVVEEALKDPNMEKVYGMRFGIDGFMNEEMILFDELQTEIIEGLRKTPGSALGSSRYKLKNEDLPKVKNVLEKYNIRYFFLIGGNDTMDTIHRVEKYCKENGYDLRGIGIPKTVDNDLFGTDHTPGFASAARYIALSVKQAGRLAEDMQRVDKYTVFQTVGREAGWLAGASALARSKKGDAPHLIYIPERKVNREKLIRDVKNTIDQYGWCSIVVGEGALWEDGTPISASKTKDNFSNVEFGAMGGSSAALNLHGIIHAETGYRGEFQITESLPMCAIDRASQKDLDEAYACGKYGVKLAQKNISGVMVSMKRKEGVSYGIEYTSVPLEEVAIKAKPMPKEYIHPEGNDVTESYLEYLRPMVGDLPDFVSLK